MPKASKPGYYAVRRGRVPGIYTSWTECETQVRGFTGAVYKKLCTEADAIAFMTTKSSTASTSTSRDILPVPAVAPEQSNVHTKAVEVEDARGCDIVYCDGACRGNGQPGAIAGIGVWWGHGDPRNISERCPGDQTNNRAELIAIVRILETTPPLKRQLLIKTDSNYSIQCVTSWIFNWMRNDFLAADGNPVKNRALIKYLAAHLHARRKTSQTVEFEHVRGHVGIQGNEAADQLANLGATKPAAPERDWEKLEKQVLQSLKPVKPIKLVDDDFKGHADGLLSDDELSELANTMVDNAARDSKQHFKSRKDANRSHTSVSPVPQNVSLPRADYATHGTIDIITRTKSPSRGTFAAVNTARPLSPAPPKKAVIVISKEELEAYACLLGDDELSTLGKDGVFDSDF